MILLLLFISAAGCNKQGSAETAAVDPGVNESYIDPEPEPESITEESKISEKIIPLSFISQNPDFPSGCEGCSAVMLMSYYGIIITPESFFSKYLPISDIPFDPDITYGGNPRDNTGLGCNAPPLAAGLNRILGGDNLHARILTGKTMQELCSEYGVEFAISRNATTDVCTLDIKAHVGTTFPIALYYGRGKGLYKL